MEHYNVLSFLFTRPPSEQLIQVINIRMRAIVESRLRGLPREDREDALAEAALSLLARLDSPEPILNLEAYAVTTAANASRQALRRRSWASRLSPDWLSWLKPDVTDESTLPARPLDLDALLDARTMLQRLWSEILLLPLLQRQALLLNLRLEGGEDAPLLPLLTVVSLRELAAALEMPPGDFASLWAHLPLSDNEIALRLAVSRQQVINLRKSARARLSRRLRSVLVLPVEPANSPMLKEKAS